MPAVTNESDLFFPFFRFCAYKAVLKRPFHFKDAIQYNDRDGLIFYIFLSTLSSFNFSKGVGRTQQQQQIKKLSSTQQGPFSVSVFEDLKNQFYGSSNQFTKPYGKQRNIR